MQNKVRRIIFFNRPTAFGTLARINPETPRPRNKPAIVKAIHWMLVSACIVAYLTGRAAFDFSVQAPEWASRDVLFAIHRLAGIASALLAIAWAAIRASQMRRIEIFRRRDAIIGLAHAILATFALLIPLTAWIGRAWGGRTEELFAVLPTYNLVSKNDLPTAHMLFTWHQFLIAVFIVLVGAHIFASFVHEFILRDGVVSKMLFFSSQDERKRIQASIRNTSLEREHVKQKVG